MMWNGGGTTITDIISAINCLSLALSVLIHEVTEFYQTPETHFITITCLLKKKKKTWICVTSTSASDLNEIKSAFSDQSE